MEARCKTGIQNTPRRYGRTRYTQYMHVSSSLSSVSMYYNYRRHSVYFSVLCPVCVSIAELYVVLEVLSVLHPS